MDVEGRLTYHNFMGQLILLVDFRKNKGEGVAHCSCQNKSSKILVSKTGILVEQWKEELTVDEGLAVSEFVDGVTICVVACVQVFALRLAVLLHHQPSVLVRRAALFTCSLLLLFSSLSLTYCRSQYVSDCSERSMVRYP